MHGVMDNVTNGYVQVLRQLVAFHRCIDAMHVLITGVRDDFVGVQVGDFILQPTSKFPAIKSNETS